MSDTKTVRVEIEFADGKIISLHGDAAEQWQDMAKGMAVMHYVHGGAQTELPWKESRRGIGDCDACAGVPGKKDCMCGGTGKAADAMVYLRKRLLRAEKALQFYADPETYYAIGIIPDPPCGEFMDDFSEVEDGVKKPGKRARTALTTVVE